MADKTSVTTEIKAVAQFMDSDTRTITIKDPAETVTADAINDLGDFIYNGGGASTLLIGDKTGASFYKFGKITRVKKTKTIFGA